MRSMQPDSGVYLLGLPGPSKKRRQNVYFFFMDAFGADNGTINPTNIHIIHDIRRLYAQSGPKVTSKWTQSHPTKQKNGRIPSHRPSQKLSIGSFGSKLRRASFESIGMLFYEILTVKHTNGHSSSHKVPQKLSIGFFGSKFIILCHHQ